MTNPCTKIARRDGAKRKDSALTYSNPRANRCLGTDPCPILDHDWLCDKVERLLGPIVAARTQIGGLRNAALGANRDLGEIVDPNILADPAMRAYRQAPRELDAHMRLDDDAGCDARPKCPQDQDAEERPGQSRTHEQATADEP